MHRLKEVLVLDFMTRSFGEVKQPPVILDDLLSVEFDVADDVLNAGEIFEVDVQLYLSVEGMREVLFVGVHLHVEFEAAALVALNLLDSLLLAQRHKSIPRLVNDREYCYLLFRFLHFFLLVRGVA